MKLTRVFRILAAALLPALLTAALPAAPAIAAGETISLTNSQGAVTSQGAIGQVITISGSGFYASNSTGPIRGVNILFGRYPVLNGTAMDYSASIFQNVETWPLNYDGTFQATFSIPSRLAGGNTREDVAAGGYYVYTTLYYPAQSANDFSSNGTAILQITPFTVVVPTTTISPDNGAVGSEVVINGTSFGVSEGVSVNYDSLALNVAGNAITNSNGAFGPARITIPPGITGPHIIIISGNNSGTTTQATFTVKPKLTIVPASGTAGTFIQVLGTGFGRALDITLTFGSDPLTPSRTDVNGSFLLTFGASSNKTAGSYDITVTDSAGNTDKASFNLSVGAINLSPNSGNVGTNVEITGSNVLPGRPITVTLNETKIATATSDVQGNFSANFTVPQLATGTYEVKISDGSNRYNAEFSVTASVDISPETSLTSPGHVGSQLTITGDGFTTGGTVTITYDANQVATTTVKADKSFSATFDAPPGKAGEHAIVATDGTNSKRFTFVMESEPPAAPVPLKPEMNLQANPKTLFDWQDVNDDSGLTYDLEVATKDDFSSSAIIFEKTGITKSEFTLTGQQRLESTDKEAPYYWHVRAVDRAGNQGPWSGTGAFSVGGLLALSQPVIYLIIGIAALVLAILGFWLGRRTSYY